ncbi:hypothetical protein FRACYDRAFT_220014 [Fragilariopsis cylindrus CCMP1102]|uniref:Uncharacterized protein n=1 Tax=Fragilariopsis cylindrus CCMP1102 TaxID=635003 RepID=A0A1E7EZC8_9STRA|nr:hypothetical protein FRACYDRAFT_220014 [Fragilariopsis cylindrus CCMP1102]|eukprot:OEU11184.1 hypothetical protein FRACYDRAFT_220014 [Fragilariopsis cylindrus CCMP1102]
MDQFYLVDYDNKTQIQFLWMVIHINYIDNYHLVWILILILIVVVFHHHSHFQNRYHYHSYHYHYE